MTKSQTEAKITEIIQAIDSGALVEVTGFGIYVRTSSGADAMLAKAALIADGFRVSGNPKRVLLASETEFYV